MSSGDTTVCSRGDVRGSDTGQGPGTTTNYNPYICGYDGYCGGYGLDIIWNPGIGMPGRPENRPGPGR